MGPPHVIRPPRFPAALAALATLVLLQTSHAAANPHSTKQLYLVCKYEQTCMAWLLEGYTFVDMFSQFEEYNNCGVSDLRPIGPHRKFIMVRLFNENQSKKSAFCKSINIILQHNLAKRDVGGLYRIRRQVYTPRGRYRGQTQSQYLALNSEKDKDDGKAEAHSDADSSRASVSGSSGMGQAQSQSIYDPSCDECYGRHGTDAESLSRWPVGKASSNNLGNGGALGGNGGPTGFIGGNGKPSQGPNLGIWPNQSPGGNQGTNARSWPNQGARPGSNANLWPKQDGSLGGSAASLPNQGGGHENVGIWPNQNGSIGSNTGTLLNQGTNAGSLPKRVSPPEGNVGQGPNTDMWPNQSVNLGGISGLLPNQGSLPVGNSGQSSNAGVWPNQGAGHQGGIVSLLPNQGSQIGRNFGQDSIAGVWPNQSGNQGAGLKPKQGLEPIPGEFAGIWPTQGSNKGGNSGLPGIPGVNTDHEVNAGVWPNPGNLGRNAGALPNQGVTPVGNAGQGGSSGTWPSQIGQGTNLGTGPNQGITPGNIGTWPNLGSSQAGNVGVWPNKGSNINGNAGQTPNQIGIAVTDLNQGGSPGNFISQGSGKWPYFAGTSPNGAMFVCCVVNNPHYPSNGGNSFVPHYSTDGQNNLGGQFNPDANAGQHNIPGGQINSGTYAPTPNSYSYLSPKGVYDDGIGQNIGRPYYIGGHGVSNGQPPGALGVSNIQSPDGQYNIGGHGVSNGQVPGGQTGPGGQVPGGHGEPNIQAPDGQYNKEQNVPNGQIPGSPGGLYNVGGQQIPGGQGAQNIQNSGRQYTTGGQSVPIGQVPVGQSGLNTQGPIGLYNNGGQAVPNAQVPEGQGRLNIQAPGGLYNIGGQGVPNFHVPGTQGEPNVQTPGGQYNIGGQNVPNGQIPGIQGAPHNFGGQGISNGQTSGGQGAQNIQNPVRQYNAGGQGVPNVQIPGGQVVQSIQSPDGQYNIGRHGVVYDQIPGGQYNIGGQIIPNGQTLGGLSGPTIGTPNGQYISGNGNGQPQYGSENTIQQPRGTFNIGNNRQIPGSTYNTGPGYGQETSGPYSTGTGVPGSIYYNNGAPLNVVDPNSITASLDGYDSDALASVGENANGTTASASSRGGNDKGRAQTSVQGTYTGSGSFSAQADISDENKAAKSEVEGDKQGAKSSAQGSGKNNLSQATVSLGSETGALQTSAQSKGNLHSSNSQVQGSLKGGLADAQAKGPGSTSSQAQIGFTPYKEGDKSHEGLKTPFIGQGTASAQSSGRAGQSQSNLQGKFKYGISYNGAAQAGASLDKDAVFPNRIPFNSLDVFDPNEKNINVDSETSNKEKSPPDITANKNSEDELLNSSGSKYNSHDHSDHHKSKSPANTTAVATPIENRRSFQSNHGSNGAVDEYTTSKDIDGGEDYYPDGFGPETEGTEAEQAEYTNYDEYNRNNDATHQSFHSQKRKGVEVKQTTGGNTQHIVLGSLRHQDAEITQKNSDHPDESRIYQPGEHIPGTGGYTIPIGFTGSVKSVASKDKTYVVGTKESPSQAQTVALSTGTGKVKYAYPAAYGRNINPKDLRSLYNPKVEDSNRYMTVSKSVTGDLDGDNNIRKQYSHTYYTKSSSCGYFTFTCTMVSGIDGRKKVCKPKIPTNPDGTPMKC